MSRIEVGQRLQPGDEIVSESGEYSLTLQHDSNFVLYRRHENGADALWASDTWADGDAGNKCVVLQDDFNLVLYSEDGEALWSSETGGANAESAYIVVQDDGNVVLYNQNQEALWSTGTS